MRNARADMIRAAAKFAGAACFFAVSALIAIIVGPAPPSTAAEKSLDVIIGGSNPPFEYFNSDGKLAGFSIDIAEALCASLTVRCTYTFVSWEDAIPTLVAGRGDAIISSMSITEERKQRVAFTNRYYRTPMQFAARKGFDRPITREGLKGLKLGAAPSTTAEAYVRQAFGGAAEIVTTFGGEDEVDLFRALVAGKVDVVLSDTLAIWPFYASPQGRDIVFVGDPIHVNEDVGIAVRKDDDALRDKLNAAIARIRLDGTYQKINAKYFPFSIY